MLHAPGCQVIGPEAEGFAEAVAAAGQADVAIVVLGLSPRYEGEEGDSQGDRTDIDLPGVQEELLKAVHATGTPVVLVLMNGSAVAVNWAEVHVPAILEAWYPGEEGGTAIAEVLFGDYNPAGRLPVTFYESVDQLPPFDDYRMQGRTYRYFSGEALYPFGFGLSYTTFAYSNLQITPQTVTPDAGVLVAVQVENAGTRAGDEVVQLYVKDIAATVPVPIRQLQGFARIHLRPGEKRWVQFTLMPDQLAVIDAEGRAAVEPGEFQIAVGGGLPDAGRDWNGVTGTLRVSGD
ncbi:MAG: Periplasmic beta-glucosidase precursor [Actinobacteria bacterium ADurb.Bin444]|nr:MAG: Periplasmic beta-glucosidase precursor [Actinobacteria bacterium ADurb.Bin444]